MRAIKSCCTHLYRHTTHTLMCTAKIITFIVDISHLHQYFSKLRRSTGNVPHQLIYCASCALKGAREKAIRECQSTECIFPIWKYLRIMCNSVLYHMKWQLFGCDLQLCKIFYIDWTFCCCCVWLWALERNEKEMCRIAKDVGKLNCSQNEFSIFSVWYLIAPTLLCSGYFPIYCNLFNSLYLFCVNWIEIYRRSGK